MRRTKHLVLSKAERLIDEDTLARANAEWLASAKHTIAGLAPVPKGFTRDWTGEQIWAAYRSEESSESPCK